MIHKIWYFHMVIQAWSRSKCTWWISWSEEEVLRRQRRPTCRTPNPSFLKSTSFFSVNAITRFFCDWISPKFEEKKITHHCQRVFRRERVQEQLRCFRSRRWSRSQLQALYSSPVSSGIVNMKLELQSKRVSNCCRRLAWVLYEYYSGIVKMRFELQYKKEFQTWREGCWPSSADTAVVIRQ